MTSPDDIALNLIRSRHQLLLDHRQAIYKRLDHYAIEANESRDYRTLSNEIDSLNRIEPKIGLLQSLYEEVEGAMKREVSS